MTDIVVNELNERLHEELADVRADAALLRADNERLRTYVETLKTSQSSAVVNELNDEIKQLRESCIQIALDKDVIIERLREENSCLVSQRIEYEADNERLTALHEAAAARAELAQIEAERLRAALRDMLKHFKQYEDAECCKRVYAQARRALEPKP